MLRGHVIMRRLLLKLFLIFSLFVLFSFSCASQKSVLQKVESLYQKKGKPMPGDWLSTNDEKHVTLEEYQQKNPSRADQGKNTIYIYQLGKNSRSEDSLLAITRQYLECVYHLKTKMADKFDVSIVPDSMRRESNGTIVQVSTHFILDTIVNLPMPADAAAGICFTKYDLYPDDNWNFVFGQAYLHLRAGVWSFSRYGDANNPDEFALVLRRTLKVAAHETGHIFSLNHCVRYECDMNGSNSLYEKDLLPMHFCPDCLEKLAWNLNFDIETHFNGLKTFYERYGFNEEADFMNRNIHRIKN